MLSRVAEGRLRRALREQPAAVLLGPRQVGKTTLMHSLGGSCFATSTSRPSDCASTSSYFLRTHDGHEIDLVLEVAGSRWALECKLSTQPERRDLEKLSTLADAIGARRRILLSRSSRIVESSTGIVCDLPWPLQNLERLIEAG